MKMIKLYIDILTELEHMTINDRSFHGTEGWDEDDVVRLYTVYRFLAKKLNIDIVISTHDVRGNPVYRAQPKGRKRRSS